MTVLARDAVASDHLVYAWPFPIGPECEVACGEDEQVIMCPAWMVGDRLGPGRHLWRTPDPMRPTSAFFVRLSPVDCTFDMTTMFLIPSTGQPVRLRATGSLQVRCADPGLLIAQFVGLPFDHVNDGVLRSVSRSVERMLARLLTRRVVMAASPIAVTEPGMLPGIVDELVAYNPTAGAVFGIEMLRMGDLVIGADDGQAPFVQLPHRDWSGQVPRIPAPNGSHDDIPLLETVRRPGAVPPPSPPTTASGEIDPKKPKRLPSVPPTDAPPPPVAIAVGTTPPGAVEVPLADDITQPGIRTPLPGAMRVARAGSEPSPASEARGAILGIGMAPIGSNGSSAVAGEIPSKVKPGERVLVPGPNGLMQSATVRQLLQGYYELEVGSSGETIWVPMANVVPE